jgi:hypothetical protein
LVPLHLYSCTNTQQYRNCWLGIRRKKSRKTQLLKTQNVFVKFRKTDGQAHTNTHTFCLVKFLLQLLLRKTERSGQWDNHEEYKHCVVLNNILWYCVLTVMCPNYIE